MISYKQQRKSDTSVFHKKEDEIFSNLAFLKNNELLFICASSLQGAKIIIVNNITNCRNKQESSDHAPYFERRRNVKFSDWI